MGEKDGFRVAMMGSTGMGKSILSNALIRGTVRSRQGTCFVLDPKHEIHPADLGGGPWRILSGFGELKDWACELLAAPPPGPGDRVLVLYRPRDIEAELGPPTKKHPGAVLNFVDSLAPKVCRPLLLVAEEVHLYAENNRIPRGLLRAATTGRSRGLSLVLTSQVPAAMPKKLLAECSTIHVFRTTEPNALKYLRAYGIPADVAEIPRWHRYEKRAGEVARLHPPVDPRADFFS